MRQFLVGFATLFVVITLTFALMRFLPGGPFDEERALAPEIKASMAAKYHLDEPLWMQYTRYMSGIVQGDFGPSYKYKTRSVSNIVGEATGVSFFIGFIAMLVGTVPGVALGSIAGLTQRKNLDGALTLLGVTSVSMPSFIFGGFLVLIFSLWLRWLPAATLATPAHYVLPVATLALVPFAYAFLLIRTTVREMKLQPFVRIKHSFGIDRQRINLRHILRNSLLPLVSILGPIAAAVMTGSFAVEYIFAVPGLGRHFITAVSNRDYTVVMGITIVYSVALITFNMLTDIAYGCLDPRLREESKTGA